MTKPGANAELGCGTTPELVPDNTGDEYVNTICGVLKNLASLETEAEADTTEVVLLAVGLFVTCAVATWFFGVETITLVEAGCLALAGELARAVERVIMDARGGGIVGTGLGWFCLQPSSFSSLTESSD